MTDAKFMTVFQNWRFYFTSEEGMLSREQWRNGFIVLTAFFVVLTLVLVGVFIVRAPMNDPAKVSFLTPFLYSYLIVYAFCIFILIASFYNLCAKRMSARGHKKTPALVFVVSVFVAFNLYLIQPMLDDVLPLWLVWICVIAAFGLFAWLVNDCGVRLDSPLSIQTHGDQSGQAPQ